MSSHKHSPELKKQAALHHSPHPTTLNIFGKPAFQFCAR